MAKKQKVDEDLKVAGGFFLAISGALYVFPMFNNPLVFLIPVIIGVALLLEAYGLTGMRQQLA